MNDLLLLVQDWRLYMLAVGMFGFAPGFVLRLAVLLYPPQDERRGELLAELYALPRWKRPMWVAEQLETALFEGPKERSRNRAREHNRAADLDATELDRHLGAKALSSAEHQYLLESEFVRAARRHRRAEARARRWDWFDTTRSRRWRTEAIRREEVLKDAMRRLELHKRSEVRN